MMRSNILCIDAGGTYFKYVVCNEAGKQIGEIKQIKSNSDKESGAIINVYGEIIRSTRGEISKIGIATPGPFDYIGGRSLMKHKFKSIYGIELKKAISEFTEAEVIFMSDTNAFALGEYDEAMKAKHKNVLAVTIGTGLGMSVIYGGELLKSEAGGVKEVVFSIPYEDGIIEDIVSARGVAALYGEGVSAKEVSDLAYSGDTKAQTAYKKMGRALGEVMKPYVEKYSATAIVIGGQVSKSLDLFYDEVKAELGIEILKTKYENSAMRGIYNECINNNGR